MKFTTKMNTIFGIIRNNNIKKPVSNKSYFMKNFRKTSMNINGTDEINHL